MSSVYQKLGVHREPPRILIYNLMTFTLTTNRYVYRQAIKP